MVKGLYLFKDSHGERTNFQAFKWNAHRYIGVSATDVFIMPAEYRLVNPGTQQSADSSSQRPRWLRRLHLKSCAFSLFGGKRCRSSGRSAGIKTGALVHKALPQAKHFDNLVCCAHASFMTCRFKWLLRAVTVAELLCFCLVAFPHVCFCYCK